MNIWKSFLKADPLPWLLEPENPSVRYDTLTEVLDLPSNDDEVSPIDPKGQPSKWVTLRALTILKRYYS